MQPFRADGPFSVLRKSGEFFRVAVPAGDHERDGGEERAVRAHRRRVVAERDVGGGGGAGWKGTNSGAGGSGIIIISYPNTYTDAVSVTGSYTYTNTGGNKIYKFTGSGTIKW